MLTTAYRMSKSLPVVNTVLEVDSSQPKTKNRSRSEDHNLHCVFRTSRKSFLFQRSKSAVLAFGGDSTDCRIKGMSYWSAKRASKKVWWSGTTASHHSSLQIKKGSFYGACHAPRLVDTNAGSLAPESQEVCATECTYQTAVRYHSGKLCTRLSCLAASPLARAGSPHSPQQPRSRARTAESTGS